MGWNAGPMRRKEGKILERTKHVEMDSRSQPEGQGEKWWHQDMLESTKKSLQRSDKLDWDGLAI